MVLRIYHVALHRAVGDHSLKTIVEALGRAATDHPDTQVRMQAIALLGSLGEKGLAAADASPRVGQPEQLRP